MTPSQLNELAFKHYGLLWVTPLSRELGVHRVTVSRWKHGKIKIPNHQARHILKLLTSEG